MDTTENTISDTATNGPTEARPPQIVLLDSERLKPMPQDLFGTECAKCEKPQAMWAFLPVESSTEDDPLPVCSSCFIYESGWGINRGSEIAAMVKDVEEAMGVVFTKDPEGKMLDPKDCDRILAAIAYISRMHYLRNQQTAAYAQAPTKEKSMIITPNGDNALIKPIGTQFRVK